MARIVKATFPEDERAYQKVLDRGHLVHTGLTGASGIYITPFPTLTTLDTSNTTLSVAITAWGPPHNRGAHAKLVALQGASKASHIIIRQLCDYCNNTTPDDADSLALTGYDLSGQPHPIDPPGPVRNLHQEIDSDFNPNEVHLQFEKPLDTVNVTGIIYNIYRADEADFSMAVFIKSVTKTRYVDTPINPGDAPKNFFYWVQPVVPRGDGALSGHLAVHVYPPL